VSIGRVLRCVPHEQHHRKHTGEGGVTEEEAKKKWCPFAKPDLYKSRAGMSRNVNSEPLKGTSCIGSACMAWRSTGRERGPIVERVKAEPGSSQPFGENGSYEVIEPGNPAKGGNWVRHEPGLEHGYCGLAGQP
jgi:hypothetical protein